MWSFILKNEALLVIFSLLGGAVVSWGAAVWGNRFLKFLHAGWLRFWLARQEKRWIAKAFTQWADGLMFLSGALRTGQPLSEALDLLVSRGPFPLRDYLRNAERGHESASPEVRINRWFQDSRLAFPRAVLLSALDSGGEAAGLLDEAAGTLQKEKAHAAKVRAHAAEAKLSAFISGGSPFAFLLLSAVSAPEMAREFFLGRAGLSVLALISLLSGGGIVLVLRMASQEEKKWVGP